MIKNLTNYHRDITMSVLEKGNLQLPVKKIVYPLRKLGKPASSKIEVLFFTQKCTFLEVQSYSFNFKLYEEHDLHVIAMS